MANIMSDGTDETTSMYAELVLLASEGIDEYLAVIAEVQDASIMFGKVEADSAKSATEWAEEFAQRIMGQVENDQVVPHYYVAALIEALYHHGLRSLNQGLNDMVFKRFAEANA